MESSRGSPESQDVEVDHREDETLQTQDVDVAEAEPEMEIEEEAETTVAPGVAAKKKQKATPARERGTSSLPASRVLKIIKADEDMCLVQKEAQMMISLATERFAQVFALAMLAQAERDRRSTLSVRDIGIINDSSDRFLFLQEMKSELMSPRTATTSKRVPKTAKDGGTAADPPALNTMKGYLAKANTAAPSIVERDDGTMEMDT